MGIGSGQDLLNLLVVGGIILVVLVVGAFIGAALKQWFDGPLNGPAGSDSAKPAATADPPVDHPQD